MLIKIGGCWVDPLEIAMIQGGDDPLGDGTMHPQICVTLRRGGSSWIEATMDEAEAALIDAGVIENPYEDAFPTLTDGEIEVLGDLYVRHFEWLARDADGKLYAFDRKPKKLGAYWDNDPDPGQPKPVRVAEGFDFIDSADEEPWCIPNLLTD